MTDRLAEGPEACTLLQAWHPHPDWLPRLRFAATDADGKPVAPRQTEGSFSGYYGLREAVTDIHVSTTTAQLTTQIHWP